MFALVEYGRLTPLGTVLLMLAFAGVAVGIAWVTYFGPRLRDYHRRNDDILAAYSALGLSSTFMHGRNFGYGDYKGHRVIVTWMYRQRGMSLAPQLLVWIKTDHAVPGETYRKGYLQMLYGKEQVLTLLGGDASLMEQGEYQVKGAWDGDTVGALRGLLDQAVADVENAG